MKGRLLELLACPGCARPLELESFHRVGSDVDEGVLRCACGRIFPIVDGIPRILENAFTLFPDFVGRYRGRLPSRPGLPANAGPNAKAIDRTRESFGYQWTKFSEMVIDFRDNFLNYIHPLDESFFPGKLGLDVGCGFGRHIYNAAKFGAEMVGVDISEAIESSRQNTRELPNVHLVQADVYHLPFRPVTFDFVYSIGVLHHLPDPEAAFRCLVPLVKPSGAVFIWVYSKRRSFVNACLEGVRAVTTRLPRPVQKGISLVAATIDWAGFIVPYKAASSLPVLGPFVRKLPLPRLKLYGQYPFQVAYADWFDRLAAPIRFYYDGRDLDGWLQRAHLDRTSVSATGLFGWRAYGERS